MNHLDKIPVKIAKTKWILACVILAGVSLLTSCGNEPFEAAYFSLIDDDKGTFAKELAVSPDGGTRTMTIVSNRTWSIDYEQASWITISPTSGKGVATITVNVAPNETLEEDYIYMNVTNNTLQVMKDFKVTRQNFLGNYKGSSLVTSPITAICTTCTVGEDPTDVTSNIVVDTADGKISMTFNATVRTGPAEYFTVILPFANAARQTVTEDGKTAFTFSAYGTYDMTSLGEALADPSVTGVKDTYVTATLANGKLAAIVLVDIAEPSGKIYNMHDSLKTTLFQFEGSK